MLGGCHVTSRLRVHHTDTRRAAHHLPHSHPSSTIPLHSPSPTPLLTHIAAVAPHCPSSPLFFLLTSPPFSTIPSPSSRDVRPSLRHRPPPPHPHHRPLSTSAPAAIAPYDAHPSCLPLTPSSPLSLSVLCPATARLGLYPPAYPFPFPQSYQTQSGSPGGGEIDLTFFQARSAFIPYSIQFNYGYQNNTTPFEGQAGPFPPVCSASASNLDSVCLCGQTTGPAACTASQTVCVFNCQMNYVAALFNCSGLTQDAASGQWSGSANLLAETTPSAVNRTLSPTTPARTSPTSNFTQSTAFRTAYPAGLYCLAIFVDFDDILFENAVPVNSSVAVTQLTWQQSPPYSAGSTFEQNGFGTITGAELNAGQPGQSSNPNAIWMNVQPTAFVGPVVSSSSAGPSSSAAASSSAFSSSAFSSSPAASSAAVSSSAASSSVFSASPVSSSASVSSSRFSSSAGSSSVFSSSPASSSASVSSSAASSSATRFSSSPASSSPASSSVFSSSPAAVSSSAASSSPSVSSSAFSPSRGSSSAFSSSPVSSSAASSSAFSSSPSVSSSVFSSSPASPASSSAASVSSSRFSSSALSSSVASSSPSRAASSSSASAGVQGDPQFSGLRGQQFQIHGTPSDHYAVLSTPSLHLNALFEFRSEGSCTPDILRRTACWSHPGNYFGQVSAMVKADAGLSVPAATSLLQNAARLMQGLPAVEESIQHSSGSGAMVHLEVSSGTIAEGLQVKFAGVDVLPSPLWQMLTLSKDSSLFVFFPTRDTALLMSADFLLRLDNSDRFLNLNLAMTPALAERVVAAQLMEEGEAKERAVSTMPHGLLGQTWSSRRHQSKLRVVEGEVDDYLVKDSKDTQFVYSRFQ